MNEKIKEIETRQRDFIGYVNSDILHKQEQYITYLLSEVERLTAENAQLKRECDAADEDIKMIGTCILCKHNQYPCSREDNGHEKCFEWRGIKESK